MFKEISMAEKRFEARVEGILPFPLEKAWEALATAKGFSLVYEGINNHRPRTGPTS